MGTGGLFLRRLRARVADEPTGFVWVEKARLAGSGYPASRSQVEWLVQVGVNSILTLTPDPLPSDYTEGLDLVVDHVPMADHQPPPIEAMARAVEFLDEQLRDGRTAVVHCLAGEGRTGCVLAAYLIRARNIGADDALSILRKAKPEFVEPRQEQAVRDFASSRKT